MQIIVTHVNSVVGSKKSEEKKSINLEVIKSEEKLSIFEEPENPTKLINYHSIIDNLIKNVKKTYIIANDTDWKLLEENKNFLIHMKSENSKDVLFRAEAEIIAPKEKVILINIYYLFCYILI